MHQNICLHWCAEIWHSSILLTVGSKSLVTVMSNIFAFNFFLLVASKILALIYFLAVVSTILALKYFQTLTSTILALMHDIYLLIVVSRIFTLKSLLTAANKTIYAQVSVGKISNILICMFKNFFFQYYKLI